MKHNFVLSSCMGCLGIAAIIWGLCLALVFYILPKGGDELFYDKEKNMYIKMIRSIDSDYGYICLGHNMDDIDNKSDYFKVERAKDYSSLDMLLSKSSDSIFVFGDSCEVMNSTHFVITPIIRSSIQETIINQTIGDTLICRHPDYYYDLYFRQHSDDYWRYFASWTVYWHEEGVVYVEDGYKQKDTNLHKRLYVIK